MPRRSASSGVTIGFLGAGVVDKEASENLIIDFLEANTTDQDDITFIIPITEDDFSQTLADVCDLAADNDIPYTAVINVTGSAAPKSIKKYIDDAAKSHRVEDVEAQVVKLLTEAPKPHLFVAFDENDDKYNEELEELAMGAIESDVKVFDLTDALAALQPEPSAEAAPEPEPEPEPAPRRRRSAAKEDPEPEPEATLPEAFDPTEMLGSLVTAITSWFEEYFPGMADNAEPEETPRRRRSSAPKEEPEPEAAAPTQRRRSSAPAEEPVAETPRRSRGRPRKDGTPAQPRTPDPSTGRKLRRS